MKRVLSLLLSLLLMASIASCAAPATEETEQTSAPKQERVTIVASTPTPSPTPTPTPAPSEKETVTVYVTETGSKYHAAGCQYLARSSIPMDLDDAKQSYDPCSKCHPPK